MYKYIALLMMLVFTGCTASAQTTTNESRSGDSMVIDATGEFMAPADRIVFNVNLTRFHENAETAFEEHKQLERFLTDLLLEKGIDRDNITAQPISISSRRYSNERGFETRQSVSIVLEEITEFEEMQITLIRNGFDNFSGRFTTSKEKEAREEALKSAVEQARRSAEILAGATGRRVGPVQSIEYTTSYGPVYREVAMAARMDVADGGMLQFQTTIPVQENVRVRFRLAD
jgi:uncharacterized protein